MIGLCVFAVIVGFRKGLVAQLGVLAGIAVGIIASRYLGDYCSTWIEEREFLGNLLQGAPHFVISYAAGIIASVTLFIAGFIVALVVSRSLRFMIRKASLGLLDSGLGAAFTFFTWFLAFSIFLNVCQAFKTEGSVIDKATLDDGRFARFVLDLAPRTFGTATAVFSNEDQED